MSEIPKDLDLVALDELDNLSLIGPDGKRVWMSREKFGGTTTSYDTQKTSDPSYGPDRLGGATRTYIPARILTKDFDGDGLQEVIIHKNYSNVGFMEKIKTFEKGETTTSSGTKANWSPLGKPERPSGISQIIKSKMRIMTAKKIWCWPSLLLEQCST